MGGLRDIESTLPPGFRFYPSDQELVCDYLFKKVIHHQSRQSNFPTMVEVDLHTVEPWELPDVARSGGNEWYFFSFRDRKYATGCRSNRATQRGYWKATGKDRMVYNENGMLVGMRKTLVFYIGRAPNGMKTSWVMHEFRLHNPHMPAKEDWVLCRVFDKTKRETSDASYYGLMEGSNGGDEEHLDYYCNIINRNPIINTGASSFPLVDPYLQPQCMSINNDNSDYRYDDDNHQWYDSYFTATTSSKNNADIYENSLFECGDEFGVKLLDLAADHQNAGLTTQQMIE